MVPKETKIKIKAKSLDPLGAKNIHKNDCTVSNNKFSSVTLYNWHWMSEKKTCCNLQRFTQCSQESEGSET